MRLKSPAETWTLNVNIRENKGNDVFNWNRFSKSV